MAFVMQKINPNILKHENAAERSQPKCVWLFGDFERLDNERSNNE